MKRMKRVLALGMAVLMCMGLTACGKDFDAAGYTKSVLDANYHAQYDKYAEYRGISESDAKKEVTEGMRTQIESAFSRGFRPFFLGVGALHAAGLLITFADLPMV